MTPQEFANEAEQTLAETPASNFVLVRSGIVEKAVILLGPTDAREVNDALPDAPPSAAGSELPEVTQLWGLSR